MDFSLQLLYVISNFVFGVARTAGHITGLLLHYRALPTIIALVLMSILVSRLFSKHINTSGTSDRVKGKVKGKKNG